MYIFTKNTSAQPADCSWIYLCPYLLILPAPCLYSWWSLMLDIFTWNLDLAASSCSDRHVPSMDHMRQSQDQSQWQSPFQQGPLGQEDSTCWHCLISWLRNEKVSHAETGSEGLLWMKYEILYPQERQNHGAPPPSHPALTTARFPVWRVLVSRSCGLKLASKNTANFICFSVSFKHCL